MKWIRLKCPSKGMKAWGAHGSVGRTYVISYDNTEPIATYRPSFKNEGEQIKVFETFATLLHTASTLSRAKKICEKHNDELSLLRPTH